MSSPWFGSTARDPEATGDGDAWAARAEEVSAWSVGQQLEHLLLADESIVGRVERLWAEGAASAGGRPTVAGYAALLAGSELGPRSAEFTGPFGS